MTAQSIAGFLVLDKSTGISSMKALARVRILARDTAKGAKSGHAGTLDPLASGVLVIGIGRPATKLLSRIVGASKRYRTEIDLSGFTASDDLESEVEPVSVEAPPTQDDIQSALGRFVGDIMQAPPAFSAIKVDGKRAYQLARENKLDSLPARPMKVHELTLVSYEWPSVTIDIHCGKGFYVRSLARELGEALGTGGYCESIRRTAVGPFDLEQARTLSDLPDSIREGDLICIEEAISMLQEDIDVKDDDHA